MTKRNEYFDDDDLYIVDPNSNPDKKPKGKGEWVVKMVHGKIKRVWVSDEPHNAAAKPVDWGKTKDDKKAVLPDNAKIYHVHALTKPDDDEVNHPNHYTHGEVEVIDIIKYVLEANEGLTAYQGFLLGCAVKYESRFTLKGHAKQDIDKAKWYLTRLEGELDD